MNRACGAGALLPVTLLTLSGCGALPGGALASLGGETAGDRGTIRVLFLNNTPQRAVFAFGTYDPLDQFSTPDFDRFVLEDTGATLDGNRSSSLLPLRCARVLGIGSPRLLQLIQRNLPDVSLEQEVGGEGIGFFDMPANPPDEAEATPTQIGRAPPFEARLGVDFPCNALLIIRLEVDELSRDPFRVDFEFIPSQGAR